MQNGKGMRVCHNSDENATILVSLENINKTISYVDATNERPYVPKKICYLILSGLFL